MEEKIIGFWNLIMKKILEGEKEYGEMDSHAENADRGIRGEGLKAPGGLNPDQPPKFYPQPFHAGCKIEKNSVRVYTLEEQRLFSSEALAFLQKLLWLRIIDIEVHEEIIEKVGLCADGRIDVDEIKIITSMVLADTGCAEWYRDLVFMFDERSDNRKLH